MSDPYLGEIIGVGFNFAPRGWMSCDGQLLAISQHSALFSLFGTMYGGDGRTTFGLPDLQGRVPIHLGQGAGLPAYRQGAKGGSPTVTLTPGQLPTHTHTFAIPCNTGDGGSDEPQNQFPAKAAGGETIYAAAKTDNAFMGSGLTGNSPGGGQAHNNMQPYLAVRFIVASTGVYPSRT